MFRLHNTVGIALFISLVPVLLLLIHFQIANIVVLLVGAAMLLGIVHAAIRIGYFHCPRCAKPFYPPRRFSNISVFRKRCDNCGLHLYENA